MPSRSVTSKARKIDHEGNETAASDLERVTSGKNVRAQTNLNRAALSPYRQCFRGSVAEVGLSPTEIILFDVAFLLFGMTLFVLSNPEGKYKIPGKLTELSFYCGVAFILVASTLPIALLICARLFPKLCAH